MECKFGRTGPSIEACGSTIKLRAKALFRMRMVTNTKANSSKTSLMGMVCIAVRMGLSTRESGLTMCSMGREGRTGLTNQVMWAIMSRGSARGQASTSGPTGTPIREIGSQMPWMALDLTSGRTGENMKATGRRILWRGKAYTLGLTGVSMMEVTRGIRRMERGVFIGQMGESMTEGGKMGNSTEKLYLQPRMVNLGREYGKMENESVG